MTAKETLWKIQKVIGMAGGEIFVIGGPVRDTVLGVEPKDIDFLVRKLTLEQIAAAIRGIGKADEVGKSFGVVKGTIDGAVFDFAIPRTKEVKTGESHTDFEVQTDPFASVEDDVMRRDFTWNAMAVPLRDFIAGDMSKLIDPAGGMGDLEARVVRAVGDPVARFMEDPLRMLRGIQFATRLGFHIETKTLEAIKEMRSKLKTVSGERIFEEFKKAWIRGRADAISFRDLLTMTGVGETLFGEDFFPISADLPTLKGEERVFGMIVAFFIMGGDIKGMKPEAIHVKFLEVAKKVAFSEDEPQTFIGNIKPLLPVMSAVAAELNPFMHSKIVRMIVTPLTAKELAVSGEEIIGFLGVPPGRIIGEIQRAMLTALWNEKLENKREELLEFARRIVTPIA